MAKQNLFGAFCVTTQSNPLKPSYWQMAAAEFHNLRTLTTVSLLLALSIVISNFFIPLGNNLHIFFTFLPKAAFCAVGGPLVGLAAGFVGDILGYLIHPNGAYFFGYTVSSMVGCFLYGVCFYQTKINLPRMIIAKTLTNLLINIGLGSLWSQMIYGKGYLFYLGRSVVKNIPLLPIEIILLFVMFAALRKIAQKTR